MKTKNKERISALSELSITKLNDKLNQITDEDFDVAKKDNKYHYYGKIQHNAFEIRNVKYSLYSSGPTIQGEMEENANDKTLLNFNVDIEEHKQHVNVILTSAILVIVFTAMLISLGNQVDKLITLLVFGAILIFAILYVMMIKQILKNTRKEEINKFIRMTESKIIQSV